MESDRSKINWRDFGFHYWCALCESKYYPVDEEDDKRCPVCNNTELVKIDEYKNDD